MATDPVERLTNLLAFLVHSGREVTQAEIVTEVPGYAPGEAGRRAFERDKRLLRDEGVPLVEAEGRYSVAEKEFFLRDLDLTDAERAALAVAVAAVPLGGIDAHAALAKLGGLGGGTVEPGAALADLEELPALPTLHASARRRAVVSFTYGDETRVVEPYALLFRERYWYVVGRDRSRDAVRTFRVDKIAGAVAVGEAATFEIPAGFEVAEAFPKESWLLPGDEPVEATVVVDAVLAAKVVAEAGANARVEWQADGSVRLTLPVTHRDAFRSWLFGLLDHAELVGPPELRAEIVGWLARIAGDR